MLSIETQLRILIFISSFLLLFSCKDRGTFPSCSYRNDIQISDIHGKPIDSKVYYFEPLTFMDTSSIPTFTIDPPYDSIGSNGSTDFSKIPEGAIHEESEIRIDSFLLEMYSKFLFSNNEPVLSNYFLGDTIYRFTWIRSFNRSKIITMRARNNEYELTTKLLPFDDDSLRVLKTHINQKDFVEFTRLIQVLDFMEIASVDNEVPGNDGAEWMLEVHYPDCYHFVCEWSGNLSQDPELKQLGQYLIELSEEIEN